jgi:glutamate racemase
MNMAERKALPIGVFDSGVGGLTVLKSLHEELPNEDLVYLGDTARLPYGTKSPASISRYAGQATAKLQEQGIKLLVVACNTASAVALETLRLQMDPLPVIGVVEPGAAAAVQARPRGKHLVLATEATVGLHAYRDAIAGIDPDAHVDELPCEMLVALAEEGWTTGAVAEAIVHRYVDAFKEGDFIPNSVILGCTHFPLLREPIASAFDDDVTIIDSASTTAAHARELLASAGLLHDAGGSLRFMATDGASRFARVGGMFLGKRLTRADIEIVDL